MMEDGREALCAVARGQLPTVGLHAPTTYHAPRRGRTPERASPYRAGQ